MESEELVKLMQQVEANNIGWDVVQEKIKVPHSVLELYTRSGPVPVTIIKNLKGLLEQEDK